MASDISQLFQNLQQKVSSFIPSDEQFRLSTLQSARQLVAALESPPERIARLTYQEPQIFASTRVLVDLRVFRLLASSNEAQSATQLAAASNADPVLLARLLKHVATENFVEETAPDEYRANELTKCLATDGAEGCIKDMYGVCAINAGLPEFFKETKYANPTSKDKTAWKYGWKTDQHYFEYIFAPGREEKASAFNNHMAWKTLGPKWFENQTLMNDVFGAAKLSKEDVLLVDVGGASGFDLIQFHKAHSAMPGRLVLQDLPASIESLDSKALAEQGVEATAHDFFTPQPVQHAKAYYMKMVLHDWPDEQCKQILSNLKPALKPGYSRILLNEIVVPDYKAGWFETSVDILMMTVHSAQERRERQWKELVESVGGLKVTKIWDIDGAVEKVVEIETS